MPQPLKTFNVLSLGAGVQSSVLAYMYELGELSPLPDFAVFADTQREPKAVYDHLHSIKKKITRFPIYTATKGDLGEYPNKIPFFLKREGQKRGMGWRQCTSEFKIAVVHKEIRRVIGLAPRKRWNAHINMILGITTDEEGRRRLAPEKWKTNTYPFLNKLKMSRGDCLGYLIINELPMPPKSSCYFCPYKSDRQWVEMRESEPEDFKRAVEYDYWMRKHGRNHKGERTENVYIHTSCTPLDKVVFNPKVKRVSESLEDACDGLMCGI